MAETMFSKFSGENGFISKDSFKDLCHALFLPNDVVNPEEAERVFRHFNKKKDDKMTFDEFQACWTDWIYSVQNPKTALLVVDVQNDFISGSLALKNTPAKDDGYRVVPIINKILDDFNFDYIVYSKDWHPPDHISFVNNVNLRKMHPSSKVKAEDAKMYDIVMFDSDPPQQQTLWPAHCVQGTEGAKIHNELKMVEGHITVHKGIHSDYDSYSTFFNNIGSMETELRSKLQEQGVTDVLLCGLAFDYCVKFSALDAKKLGFGVAIIRDATGTISNDTAAECHKDLLAAKCLIISTDQIQTYSQRKVRHPDLAFSTITSD